MNHTPAQDALMQGEQEVPRETYFVGFQKPDPAAHIRIEVTICASTRGLARQKATEILSSIPRVLFVDVD